MDLPDSVDSLRVRLVNLREARRALQVSGKKARKRRFRISASARALILRKTAGRCHICGGAVEDFWQADHILAHSSGGASAHENFLPAHALCNNYRWDYSSEEFQWVLKIGVWARKKMEDPTGIGSEMLNQFFRYDVLREKRRKTPR